MIFKFESEFREIGSTGNVFIYLKGTASIGDNNETIDVEPQKKKLIEELKYKKEVLTKQTDILREKSQFVTDNIGKIPRSKSDIVKLLGK